MNFKKEILSELLDAEQFDRVLALFKIIVESCCSSSLHFFI